MWYIGQDVVCVATPKQSAYYPIKKGAVYSVRGIRASPCKCPVSLIDVGHLIPNGFDKRLICCSDCDSLFKTDGTLWYSELYFKPLDELASISEVTEVLNKPAFQ